VHICTIVKTGVRRLPTEVVEHLF